MKRIFYFLIPIFAFFGIQLVGIQKVNAANSDNIQISTDTNYIAGKGFQFTKDYVKLDTHWMSFVLPDDNSYIENLALRYSYRFPVPTSRYNVTFTIATLKDFFPAAFINGKACQPFYSKYVNSVDTYYHLVNYSCVDLDGSVDMFELNLKGPFQGPEYILVDHDFNITRFDDSSSAINDSLNNINDSINSTNSKLDEVNGSINNSDVSGANSDLNNFTENELFKDNTGILAIIQAPINMLNSITSATCSPLSLPIPYLNVNLDIPCLSTIFAKHISSEFLTLLKLAINGFIIYKVLCSLAMDIHNYKDPDSDKLEVLDL